MWIEIASLALFGIWTHNPCIWSLTLLPSELYASMYYTKYIIWYLWKSMVCFIGIFNCIKFGEKILCNMSLWNIWVFIGDVNCLHQHIWHSPCAFINDVSDALVCVFARDLNFSARLEMQHIWLYAYNTCIIPYIFIIRLHNICAACLAKHLHCMFLQKHSFVRKCEQFHSQLK